MVDKTSTAKFGKKNIDLSDLASLPSDRNASGNLMYKFDWLKEKGGEKTTGKEIAEFLLAHDSLTLDQKVILTRLLNQYFSYHAFYSDFEKDFEKWDRKNNPESYPEEPMDKELVGKFIGGGIVLFLALLFLTQCVSNIPQGAPDPCDGPVGDSPDEACLKDLLGL